LNELADPISPGKLPLNISILVVAHTNSAFFLSGTVNEEQPKCGDAVWLGSKGRYALFQLWINVWVASETVILP